MKGTSDTWRPPSDEEPGVNKAIVKAFIMSAFEEYPKKEVAKTTIAAVETEVTITDETEISPREKTITLSSILKHANNQK